MTQKGVVLDIFSVDSTKDQAQGCIFNLLSTPSLYYNIVIGHGLSWCCSIKIILLIKSMPGISKI